MVTNFNSTSSQSYDLSSDTAWSILYPLLRSFVTRLVYAFKVPSWYRQEDDVIEDIVQETALRTIEFWQKAERGEAAPIRSLEQVMLTIALNYCRDLRRRDHRLVHVTQDDFPFEGRSITNDQFTFTEAATENAYRESLFALIAPEVAKFPHKQRRALLIDLANLMAFDSPTALEEAFLEVGIQLQEYQQPLPESPVERIRHASLLNHAYRRVVNLPCVHEYISAA